MGRFRQVAIATGMLALGVGSGLALGGLRAEASEDRTELDDLRESLQMLREDVEAAQARQRREDAPSAGPAPTRSNAESTSEEAELVPPSPEEMRARSDYEGRRWIRALEDAVSLGPRDSRVPGDMRATLLAADLDDELTVEEIECNAELCSVHIAHEDPEAAKRILRSLWTHEHFRGAAFIRREQAGEAFASTWVVARDGFDLPTVEIDQDEFRPENGTREVRCDDEEEAWNRGHAGGSAGARAVRRSLVGRSAGAGRYHRVQCVERVLVGSCFPTGSDVSRLGRELRHVGRRTARVLRVDPHQ